MKLYILVEINIYCDCIYTWNDICSLPFKENMMCRNSNGVPKKIIMESLIIEYKFNSIKIYMINS